MPAFTVALHQQHLVLRVGAGLCVEVLDLICEARPLRLFSLGVKRGVGVVGAIQQAKVGLGLRYQSALLVRWGDADSSIHT
jgi:hypothetical protein